MRRAWLLIAITVSGCGGAARHAPMSFAPNRGQFAPSVRFAAKGAGYELAATDSGYVLRPDGKVGFRLGRYDAARALVIDPVLAYSAYLGGDGTDDATAAAAVAAGSAFVTGQTQSTNFPGTPGPKPNGDAFVTRLAIGTGGGPAPIVTPPPVPPAPQPGPPTPETTITARPPAQTPDQAVQSRFIGRMPGQINPTAGIGARASAKPGLSAVRAAAAAAGAVRVPLRLNAAAKKLRRKRALSARLTIAFQPADGPVLTTSATVKLKRAAAKRPSRRRSGGRRSGGRAR